MNITCHHCGRQHALYWLQGMGVKKLHYTCDHYPSRVTRASGYQEIRHTTRRCQYYPIEPIPEKQLASLPIVFTKGMIKKQADANQEKLPL